MCLCACVYEQSVFCFDHLCVYVREWVCIHVYDVIVFLNIFPIFFKIYGLSLSLKLKDCLDWVTNARYLLSISSHACLFMWVLGIQTQVAKDEEQTFTDWITFPVMHFGHFKNKFINSYYIHNVVWKLTLSFPNHFNHPEQEVLYMLHNSFLFPHLSSPW